MLSWGAIVAAEHEGQNVVCQLFLNKLRSICCISDYLKDCHWLHVILGGNGLNALGCLGLYALGG